MRFSDQVAIVTGGGRGIGQATAIRLATEGARVVIADKVQDTSASTVEMITNQGGQAVLVVADVTRAEDVRRMVQNVMTSFTRIDILVNNAGWFGAGQPFLETGEDYWDRIVDVNLKSALLCSHAVLGQMTKQGSGKIVNISSGAGKAGNRFQVPYSAAKAGVIGLTKALAWEVACYKINVNCICPGVVNTPLSTEATRDNPERIHTLEKIIPWQRLGRPEDIASQFVSWRLTTRNI